MLIGDMLLNEGRRLEEFLARFASKFAFIFLFDVWLDCLRQLPTTVSGPENDKDMTATDSS
jgi:hypothetical protein